MSETTTDLLPVEMPAHADADGSPTTTASAAPSDTAEDKPARPRRTARRKVADADADVDVAAGAEGSQVSPPVAEPAPSSEQPAGPAEESEQQADAGGEPAPRPTRRPVRRTRTVTVDVGEPEAATGEPGSSGNGRSDVSASTLRTEADATDAAAADITTAETATVETEPIPELPGIDAQPDDEPQPSGRRRRRRRRGRPGAVEPTPQVETTYRETDAREAIPCAGYLDTMPEGYGFLRCSGYTAGANDVYVSTSQVKRFFLRKGDLVDGYTRPARESEKYPALLRITTVNGMDPTEAVMRPRFEELTPLFPDQRLPLERDDMKEDIAQRIIDLISPIGKGQRGLIVSPPRAGKTTIMKQICQSIEYNNPEVHLIVLLVDERPEEVTDMRRSVKGEVVYSTFDRPSDEHTQVSEVVIERAKRLVEMGKDVVIMLDGITRLARAYNLSTPASGRIMSGGVDSTALYPPKKFFGAARNIEEGGSLTILATALVETGSRMDEVIFEEFKGTGNWELRLDRKVAEKRVYPALDVAASATRKEELLFTKNELMGVWKLRRVMHALEPSAALELLIDRIKTTRSNDAFLAEIAKAPVGT